MISELVDFVSTFVLFLCYAKCKFWYRDAVTDVFLDALAEAALMQLHHFSARQLATLAYNYGTLNHWGRNDQELLDAITIRMLHQHLVSQNLLQPNSPHY